MNYENWLGHNLSVNGKFQHMEYLQCSICDSRFSHYFVSDDVFMWGTSIYYNKNITCDEVIIKNIIE